MPSPFAYADPAATAPMARAFTLASPATLRLQASALALPGPGLDALLDTLPDTLPGRALSGPGVLQVNVASTQADRRGSRPA